MTRTYVAWNGETCPWPPPDGWFHATDGRWWAPGAISLDEPIDLTDPPPVDDAGRRRGEAPAPSAIDRLQAVMSNGIDTPTIEVRSPAYTLPPIDPTPKPTTPSPSKTNARQRTRTRPDADARRQAWRARLENRRLRTIALIGVLTTTAAGGTIFGVVVVGG